MTHKEIVLEKKYKEYFDQAFMLEVSEYLFDPMTAFKNVNKLLKTGGIFWLSVHFIYPVHNPIKYDYLRYTENGAKKLLNKAGFKVLEVTPRLAKSYAVSRFAEDIRDGSASDLEVMYVTERMRREKHWGKHNHVGCLIKAKKM